MGKINSGSKKKKTDSWEINEDEINKREKEKIAGIIYERVNLTAKNDSQKKLLKSIRDNQITLCNGVAGSGKTICAIYMALDLLSNPNNHYQRIVLVKSVTVLKNEELGFLKGDITEKVDPFMESFKSNAKKLFKTTNVDMLFDSSIIKFKPLAYTRGINLDNTIVLADETQNISIDNLRTLMTRIGAHSKLICLGDVTQCDLKNKAESSLQPALDVFDGVEDIGTIIMDENDENCRNPLIKIIDLKFKEIALKMQQPRSTKRLLND